jgi:hypothetical protein
LESKKTRNKRLPEANIAQNGGNVRLPMMMDRLFIIWLQGHLEHTNALVLEDDFVVLWSRDYRI